ncbi:MAG: phosphatidate cytidylyltransferase, partial [Vulcanimicrobiota bacterium]
MDTYLNSHNLSEKKKDSQTLNQAPTGDSGKTEPEKGKKGNMITRIIVGVLLAGISFGLIIWGALPLSIEILIFSLIGVTEFYQMAERKKIRPSRAMGYLAVTLLCVVAYLNKSEYFPELLVGLVLISMLGYIFRKGFHVSSFLDVGVTILGFLYVGLLFSYLIFIRKIEGAPFMVGAFALSRGAGLTILLVIVNSFTDIGAFFVGKAIGEHKLAPRISPQKTIEGAVGGVVGAITGALLMGLILKISTTDLVTIAVLCSIFAQLGDLWASI